MTQQFQQLLEELQTISSEQEENLAKSLAAEDGGDDEAIQAAAADGGDAGEGNPEDDDQGGEGGGDGGEGDDEPIAKSMTAVINGEETEVVDATEIIKSLSGRVENTETVLAKALETTINTIKAQGEMIKSLQAEVQKLAGQGRGRKAVLTVVEKPDAGEQTLAKSEGADGGMTPQQFMAKANAAFADGKLTGKELTTIDVALRTGQIAALDESLIAKALS